MPRKPEFKNGDVVICKINRRPIKRTIIKGVVEDATSVRTVPESGYNYKITSFSGKTYWVFEPDYDMELCKISSKGCDKCRLRFKCFTEPKE